MSGCWRNSPGSKTLPNVGQVRSKGLLFGIELVEAKESKQPAGPKMVTGFNNVLALSPPLNITDEDLTFIAGTP